MGYKYHTIRFLVLHGVMDSLGHPMGVYKEADVFAVTAPKLLIDEHPYIADEPLFDIKLHRLGRSSFRPAKFKRD